jgi:protein arginine kinase activator
MICEHCHKNEASVHVTQSINGITQEKNLCTACARELGINQPFKTYFEDFFKTDSNTGQSIFDTAGGIPAFGSPATRSMVCSACGQRYDEFRRSGLLGCSKCYEAFGDRLDAIFRRIQGGSRHVGRKACETAGQQELQLYRHQLVELKQQLQLTVAEEDYENAVGLRDKIHDLQKQIDEMERQFMSENCRTVTDAGESDRNMPDSPRTEEGDGHE